MRCSICDEDVDETKAIGLSADTAQVIGSNVDERLLLLSWRFHIRYIAGVLPPGPDVAETHVGPVICGPLLEQS